MGRLAALGRLTALGQSAALDFTLRGSFSAAPTLIAAGLPGRKRKGVRGTGSYTEGYKGNKGIQRALKGFKGVSRGSRACEEVQEGFKGFQGVSVCSSWGDQVPPCRPRASARPSPGYAAGCESYTLCRIPQISMFQVRILERSCNFSDSFFQKRFLGQKTTDK